MSDQVNSPSHYTKGRVEAIEIIEDVVAGAPDPVAGYLVGQTLKYLLRAWHKEDASPRPAESCLVLESGHYCQRGSQVTDRRRGGLYAVAAT